MYSDICFLFVYRYAKFVGAHRNAPTASTNWPQRRGAGAAVHQGAQQGIQGNMGNSTQANENVTVIQRWRLPLQVADL